MPELKNVDSRAYKISAVTHGFLSSIYRIYSVTLSLYYFDKEKGKKSTKIYVKVAKWKFSKISIQYIEPISFVNFQ